MLQNYFMEISSMYRKGQNLAGVGQIRQKIHPAQVSNSKPQRQTSDI